MKFQLLYYYWLHNVTSVSHFPRNDANIIRTDKPLTFKVNFIFFKSAKATENADSKVKTQNRRSALLCTEKMKKQDLRALSLQRCLTLEFRLKPRLSYKTYYTRNQLWSNYRRWLLRNQGQMKGTLLWGYARDVKSMIRKNR